MYLQVQILLSRMLCGYFAHQRKVVFEGSAAAPSAYVHSNIARSGFGVVLVRLVMQDAMRAVFDVWPEVRIPVYADDKSLMCNKQKGQRNRRKQQDTCTKN